MFALDTNAVIHFFKGVGRVGDRLLATAPRELALPAVVLYEIEVGLLRSTESAKRRRQFEALCSALQILPFGEEEARTAAQVRAELEDAGASIGPLDNLIAGTARHHGAILVTHNTDEFGRVRGLTIEDWY